MGLEMMVFAHPKFSSIRSDAYKGDIHIGCALKLKTCNLRKETAALFEGPTDLGRHTYGRTTTFFF